jgi:oligopeptide/dipeptide ABC transporter ATP-binding protein
MSAVLLSVEDLYVRFRTYAGLVHAVNGISFEIQKGEVFGLVGETGCGKSVTSLALLRLIPPPGEIEAKRINLGGDDLLSLDEAQMQRVRGKRIAMVFQDPTAGLNPVFSINDQITIIIRHHEGLRKGKAEDLAKETLAAVGLPSPAEIMKMYPHELSGGMQQRVMIAMALSSGAELLIADEPTTALDVTIQAQILTMLIKLRETHGLSILLITHNLGVVAQTCDRVGILYAGSLIEVGNTIDVFQHMKHPYTRAMLAAVPQAESRGQRLVDIPGSVPSGLNPLPGCAYHPRCPHVMDICQVEKPSLQVVGEGHTVACFLHIPSGDREAYN